MTAPAVLSPSEVRGEIQASWADFVREATGRPMVELYDKNWEHSVPLIGETTAKFIRKRNDTGEGNLVVFGNNAVRQWIVDELGEWEDLHIRVRTGYMEWTGKATTIAYESDAEGFEYISVNFLHEFEHAKKMVCFNNPFFPAEFQWPKLYAYAGPAVFGIMAMFFLNTMRRFALPWTFGDNLFDPASWLANFNPAEWPIVVVPKSLLFDTSSWCILATRFGNFYDVVLPTLKDAGLNLRVYRWFPGMPQPAPDHYTLTETKLVVDVEDMSGYTGPTGTLLDGAAHLITQVADDLINEVVHEVAPVDSPEYSIGGWLGTTRENPWVTFRSPFNSNGVSGVESVKMTRHKATASSVVTGGHSPDWVNAGLTLLLNAALGYLGMAIGNPGLGLGIFEEQVHDVILAFHRAPNPIRVEKMGANGPPWGEFWESSGSKGFSPAALQAIRTGFFRTRAYTTFEVKLRAGAPYWPGAHFLEGHRVNCEVGTTEELYTDFVESIEFGWGRDQDVDYAVLVGDGVIEDQPNAILSRQIGMVRELIQSVGVSA